MIAKNNEKIVSTLRIAVDAMGGDFGPKTTIPAVIKQALDYPDVKYIVYGHREHCQVDTMPANIVFDHVDHHITMNDVPTHALRYGRTSSMAMALRAVKEGRADACITAGNTGALVALARHILGMYSSIDKPALCKIMPTRLGRSYMLDLGATINCSAEQLIQFARLGLALYLRDNTNIKKLPSVRLLNIGSEHFKGMDVIRHAADALQKMNSLDYQGYIEGDEIYRGIADIIVCDGFVGNIALKSSEGAARFMLEGIQAALNTYADIGNNDQDQYILKALTQWHDQCDPARYNGAQLLGVKGLVIKSHGGVSQHAFSQSLLMLIEQIQNQSNASFDELLSIA